MNYKQFTSDTEISLNAGRTKMIMKRIAPYILVGLFLFGEVDHAQAQAENLYVDSAAVLGGDGSKHDPFRRITDAIDKARALWRANHKANIKIRVEPGTYIGRYSNTDPYRENFPVILDIPNLVLTGSTSMLVDDSGLPTGDFEPGKESLLKADPPLAANQSLLIVRPTDVVLTGIDIDISKLSLNVGYSIRPGTLIGTGISVEQVQNFSLRNNYITGFGDAGIRTRASSGRIQGNYFTQVGAGTIILAGSLTSPASVLFSGNRSVNNFNGGIFLNGSAINNASFDTLSAVVDGNDLSDSNANAIAGQGFGIRVAVVRHDPPDLGTSGNVIASISNNRISNNRFGLSIDAGFPYRIFGGSSDPRSFNGTLDLSLENNLVVGNTSAPALISLTRSTATLTPSQLSQWKYLEHSTFNITDYTGDLNGYWLDHPLRDPVDGRTLQNVVRINGSVISNGRYVPVP